MWKEEGALSGLEARRRKQRKEDSPKEHTDKRCGWELSVLERMERNLLKWFWACGKNEGGKIG